METTPATKQRSQSQCREWERQRRNKFNDAITKLGEIVKALSKASESPDKESSKGKKNESMKYPKIEIIQKAIIYLSNCTQEKTELKDASTQVYLDVNNKIKKQKFVKIMMKKKSKQTKLNETDTQTINVKENKENKKEHNQPVIKNAPMPKLPTLLPRCKKAPENTIVVLPATPYLFPQRPFLLPSLPPAIVVVDNNLQPLSKAVPLVSRNGTDTTKTTMVNVLPISAYSCPLSVTKQNKSSVRLKCDAKKVSKQMKPNSNKKRTIQNNHVTKMDDKKSNDNGIKKINRRNEKNSDEENHVASLEPPTLPLVVPAPVEKDTNIKDFIPSTDIKDNVQTSHPVPKITEQPKPDKSSVKSDNDKNDKNINGTSITTTSKAKETSEESVENDKSSDKIILQKNIVTEDKEHKLPNILDTTLDQVVDGGNARLELAEEFLAASPTAAFLMSFPLVSGNRADSPADESQTTALTNQKDITQKRNDLIIPTQPSTTASYYVKSNNNDNKIKTCKAVVSSTDNKLNEQPKYVNNVPRNTELKVSKATTTSVSNENPFLNLPTSTGVPTTCSLSDASFGLEFENNYNKLTSNQPQQSYGNNSNLFYKNDPFSIVKNTIYSTSSISSNHDFNGIGLYPCAMEKYASKSKADFTNLDDSNVMKIGSSRLTYDIDLGWSHKSFDFVSCTANSTLGKDNIVTTVSSSTPYNSSYNPFNPEFHVPLVSTANKKDSAANKPNSSFADTLTSYYSQHNLWPEEPFYNNTNVSKSLTSKHQNYPLPIENTQNMPNFKSSNIKQYEIKGNSETTLIGSRMKTGNDLMPNLITEMNKKSASKMHINWMTSEIRPMQTVYNSTHTETKEPPKTTNYNNLQNNSKRIEHSETNNYFPISMHNFPAQPVQEEFQVWPSASTRPLGTTEISIDPPPINLPTLVGDLALGPHDKKKNMDPASRTVPHQDLQNCSNFFSVTQLMNRSNESVPSRYQPTQIESSKPIVTKHATSHYSNDSNNRKSMSSRVENHAHQPYSFNNSKLSHPYENLVEFSQSKSKNTNKPDKNPKAHKNNYSAEALLRGGNCTQKVQDNSAKFPMPAQKYNDFNAAQDSSVAQVSHFPPIIDYSENSYTGQQFSGTSLYNATTNTLSNSFYTNFISGSSNLMPSNYTSGPFAGEFIDYNQPSECNFTNHKYDDLKMRNNPSIFACDKNSMNYKSSRRESAAKHKLECSKKDSSKKYQSKRAKLNNEGEEWNESSHPLWQNKHPNKRHTNLVAEEIPFPNYVSNQMHSQYQPDFFNAHLMPSNMQAAGANVDKSLSNIPITSRANFNLSTIFPEITMKVQ